MKEFKGIEDEGDRLEYALNLLDQLGEGGSRTVFRLSPRFVLKIAHSDRGKSQNATEAAISEDPAFGQVLARVHQHASDFSWIVSDLVRPLREEEFESFVGIPFEDFLNAVKGRDYHRWTGNPKWKVSGSNAPHRDETIGTYGLIDVLRKLVKSKKLHEPELNDIGHWGKTGDNRIVILDYGVDSGNWKQQTLYPEGRLKSHSFGHGFYHFSHENESEPILEVDEMSEIEESIELEEIIREFVLEVVRKCGDDWCLYTKGKKGGKRRRLGTHSSKAAAYRQERAIKAHGG